MELYPRFQAWLRERQPSVLAVWSKNDPQGAEALKRDTTTEVILLGGGHFLLESHLEEVAERIRAFLAIPPKW